MSDLVERLEDIKDCYVEAECAGNAPHAANKVGRAIDEVKSMQQEIERLKAELDCTNKQWVKLDVLPHGTTLDSIKAQGIEDALSAVGRPYGDDTIGLHNWLEDYADNLRTKEGE